MQMPMKEKLRVEKAADCSKCVLGTQATNTGTPPLGYCIEDVGDNAALEHLVHIAVTLCCS